ncbi:MAG: TonB-dependent receptor, partial [Ferruginibacter sp.]
TYADWSIETEMLTVSYDSTKLSRKQIEKKIASVGHDTEDFTASDKVYEKLPPCCLYVRKGKEGSTANTASVLIPYSIAGTIKGNSPDHLPVALFAATITDLHTGNHASSDSSGFFQINSSLPVSLAISFAGYRTDTVQVTQPSDISIMMQLSGSNELAAVVVTSRKFTSLVASNSPFNTLSIGVGELKKAACCNLSESFETSPSVDVSYADAVTGIKQIQLLGLAGNYTQITTENTPEIHGLSSVYGLTFIPGPWVEGIQVTKGTGSVANGYESIAGQINVEELKPNTADKIFVNGYANANGRLETTVNLSKNLNDKWSTGLLTHVNGVVAKKDANNDGFLDNPLGRQFNVINRWRYSNDKLFAQFSFKALNDHRQSGQVDFNPSRDKFTSNKYGVGINVEQYAFAGKLGYVFPGKDYKSVGLIFSANTFNNSSYYGLTSYTGRQNSVYANLIYQSIIGSTINKFRTGLSFANDDYNENVNLVNFKRREVVPGAFFEYTFTPNQKFTAIAGLRADYHNEYKTFITPRLNIKYDITTKTNLRFSAGSGLRTANIFAENIGLFASSRQYNILNKSTNYGYGLQPEKAWNYGVNLVHNFKINNQNASFSFDAYRTDFVNQVVVDVDASPQ